MGHGSLGLEGFTSDMALAIAIAVGTLRLCLPLRLIERLISLLGKERGLVLLSSYLKRLFTSIRRKRRVFFVFLKRQPGFLNLGGPAGLFKKQL